MPQGSGRIYLFDANGNSQGSFLPAKARSHGTRPYSLGSQELVRLEDGRWVCVTRGLDLSILPHLQPQGIRGARVLTDEEAAEWLTAAGLEVPEVLARGVARVAASDKTRKKQTTAKHGAKNKLVGAITLHHRYAHGGALNQQPIGVRQLARLAKVSKATASAFFKREFGAHDKYRAACRDASGLVAALRLLNDEFRPRDLDTPVTPEGAEAARAARGQPRRARHRDDDE